jgi:predicted ArsR family transcriptional regulator
MDVATQPPEHPLSLPVRAKLFETLVELRRPASTQELARRVGRHHNTIRSQLTRLADAGLVERRTVPQVRGRPRHEWAIAPGASPGGQAPEAYTALGRWLARATGRSGGLQAVEATGREIGRELAPEPRDRPAAQTLRDVLAALGFAPRLDADQPGLVRFVLTNCPYRAAVRENPRAVCTLHRGITRGLLDQLAPTAGLADFVARDPDTAGCLIDVAFTHPPTTAP